MSDREDNLDNVQVGHPAGLGRRLGAMLYDGLLLVGIWATGVALIVLIRGESTSPWASQALAVAVYFSFFGYFWSKQGQSLGMLAWKIKVVTPEGKIPDIRAIGVRLAVALASFGALGAGYFWLWTNENRQTWHGLASQTLVVHIPQTKKSRHNRERKPR